tara:strand:+ start:676 stop:948 length:273 start_codon:yes stop_codon:yes gene_type:complete
MKRWVVILTAGSGYSQKYSPPLTFFKRFADAEKYLRAKIKKQVEYNIKARVTGRGWGGSAYTIKEFLESNDLFQFETNEGEFFLEQVVFE